MCDAGIEDRDKILRRKERGAGFDETIRAELDKPGDIATPLDPRAVASHDTRMFALPTLHGPSRRASAQADLSAPMGLMVKQ